VCFLEKNDLSLECFEAGRQILGAFISADASQTRMRPGLSRAIFHPWAAMRPLVTVLASERVLSPDFVSLRVRNRVLHQTRIEVLGPSEMSRRSVGFETWKPIGTLMPAQSRGMAERQSVRQLSPGSGEGQATASHVQ
jgi:hypothetical protein